MRMSRSFRRLGHLRGRRRSGRHSRAPLPDASTARLEAGAVVIVRRQSGRRLPGHLFATSDGPYTGVTPPARGGANRAAGEQRRPNLPGGKPSGQQTARQASSGGQTPRRATVQRANSGG